MYLFVPPVYKHIAPLGLNPSRFPALNPENPLILRILIQTNGTCRPSGAKSLPFSRLPFLSPSPLPPFRFNTCRPSGALVYLFVPPVYKHIAPLGLNPSRFPALNPENPLILRILIQTNGTCRPAGAKSVVFPFSRFLVLSPSPLPPFRFNTCRPSGALVYLFVPPVYKHIAPLGLNPSRFPALNPENPLILRILIQTNGTCRPAGAKSVVFPFSRFLVLSPSPLPRFPLSASTHVAPLGLWCICLSRRSINISPRWG